jgi:transposase
MVVCWRLCSVARNRRRSSRPRQSRPGRLARLVGGIREAIERERATLRYLPKYSPDLNPIEMSYSKQPALRSRLGFSLT